MKRGYFKTYAKILLIILLLAIAIYMAGHFFKTEYDAEQFETIKTDMLLIEAKTKIIGEKVKIKEDNAVYIGRKIEETKEEDNTKQLQEQGVINLEKKENRYYILEKSHLEELGLANLNLEDGYYIVEYNSNEIIYSKGIQDKDGNTVYTLSDIEKRGEEKQQEESSNTENNKNDTINEKK